MSVLVVPGWPARVVCKSSHNLRTEINYRTLNDENAYIDYSASCTPLDIAVNVLAGEVSKFRMVALVS